jgi:NAD(P)-dependent dehydrogenase (short-subunit alcohol dehydrogenase family)
MKPGLQGRVALVTGAGRGIGRAIALGLAEDGAALALIARTKSEIETVADEIRARGGRAAAVPCDVADPSAIEKAITSAVGALGPIDVLVNNAGNNVIGRFTEVSSEVWWSQLEVNVRGPYWFCRAVVPGMVERRWGRIINISSVVAKIGAPFVTAYATAKAGMLGFTRALAAELGPTGVTVNAVCPGFVQTALTDVTFEERAKLLGIPKETIQQRVIGSIPQRTAMTPDEVAPAVRFLASEGAYRTTGEALNVAGGMVMH